MAPPHLHPRSRMTSSLFATTVLASFFVVALPHLLPCPAPRRVYADGKMPPVAGGDPADPSAAAAGRRMRRRRKLEAEAQTETEEGGIVEFQRRAAAGGEGGVEKMGRKKDRECPVPKPGGILGEWLGFHKESGGSGTGRDGR